MGHFELIRSGSTNRYMQEWVERYQSAEPFPHLVLDDFLTDSEGKRLASDFPGIDRPDWDHWNTPHEDKFTLPDITALTEHTRRFLGELNSPEYVSFLENLTGIPDLLPDPQYFAAGATQVLSGGRLGIHSDFTRHLQSGHYRRVTTILYLNTDWRSEYGGELEFWSHDMKRCVQRISPLFNRCVIFPTIPEALHGHPEPYRCPRGERRISLSAYYYSVAAPPRTSPDFKPPIFYSRPVE